MKNADGSYDIELVIEFFPQRLFDIGLIASGVTLFTCFGYLVFSLSRRKRSSADTNATIIKEKENV